MLMILLCSMQLGSFLSAQQAKNDDLKKHLAASEENARIDQKVRDHEERGVSAFHHWVMFSRC